MSNPLIDKLIEDGAVVRVETESEANEAIQNEVTPLTVENEFSYTDADALRQALNQRHLKHLKPIRVDMQQTDLGEILAPVFLSPPNNSAIDRHALNLSLGPFTDTKKYKDSHASTLWWVAEHPDFLTLSHNQPSIVFKTSYQIPATALKPDKTYYIKAKFIGLRDESDWSDVLVVTTKNVEINQPAIVAPTPNSVLEKTQFNLVATAFSTTPINETAHQSSTWQVSTSIDFALNTLVWANTSSTDKTSITVPVGSLSGGMTYFIRVKFNGVIGESLWSSPIQVTSNYAISKPSIVSPTNNATVSKYNFKLKGSAFTTVPANIAPLAYTEAILAKDVNFDVIVQTFKQNGTLGEVDIASSYFDFNKDYYLKLRYGGSTAISAWSDPIKITTSKVLISKPVISEPTNNGQSSRVSFRIRLDPFETVPAGDTQHISTTFQVSTSSGFNEVDLIYNETVYSDLTTRIVPTVKLHSGETYYVRAKYTGVNGESLWSDTCTTTIYDLGITNTPTFVPTAADDTGFATGTNKVIGHVKSTRVVLDSNDSIIFGNWNIAKDVAFTIEKREELISVYADHYPIDLTSGNFELGETYWFKVSFKTQAANDFEAFTDPIAVTIGETIKPIIAQLDFLNVTMDQNILLLKANLMAISEGFVDKTLKRTVWISNDVTFATKEVEVIDNPSFYEELPCSSLKGLVHVKIQDEGFYFGETEWSEPLTLETGDQTQPTVLDCVISYDESSGSLKSYVDLSSSLIQLTQERKDQHIKSKWLVSSDLAQQNIILNTGFITDKYSTHKEVDLTGVDDLYITVQYQCDYLGLGLVSEVFHVPKTGYVRKPSILTPVDGIFLPKGTIVVSASTLSAVPDTLTHTATHWLLEDDTDTLVWELETTTAGELTTVTIPDQLACGGFYKLKVKYKTSSELWSDWSAISNITIKPNILTPVISLPIADSTVDDAGFNILFSGFVIEPFFWDAVEKVAYQIATDVDFTYLPVNMEILGNVTSIGIGCGTLVPNTDHWVRVKQIGSRSESTWSDPIKFKTPVSSIGQPTITTPTVGQTVGALLNNNFTSSAFVETAAGAVPHLQTEWALCTSNVFDVDVKVITVDFNGSNNMLQMTIDPWELVAATTYYTKVRYRCGNSIGPWSAARNFVTQA